VLVEYDEYSTLPARDINRGGKQSKWEEEDPHERDVGGSGFRNEPQIPACRYDSPKSQQKQTTQIAPTNNTSHSNRAQSLGGED
jgi:hypothetical protein